MNFPMVSNHLNLKISSRTLLKCLLVAPLFSSALALLRSDSVKPTCQDLLYHRSGGTQTGLGTIQSVMRSDYLLSLSPRLADDFSALASSLIPVFCDCTIKATQQFNREHTTFFLRGMDYLFAQLSSNMPSKERSEIHLENEVDQYFTSLGIFKLAFLNWVANALLAKNYGSPDFRMPPSMVFPPAINPDFLVHFPDLKMKIQGQTILDITIDPKSLNDLGIVNVIFTVASEHNLINRFNYHGTLDDTLKPHQVRMSLNLSNPFGDNLLLFKQNLPPATPGMSMLANIVLLYWGVAFVSLYFCRLKQLSTDSSKAEVLALDIHPKPRSLTPSNTFLNHLKEFEKLLQNAFNKNLSVTLNARNIRTLELKISVLPEVSDLPIPLPILACAFLGTVLKQVTLVESHDSVVATCPVGVSLRLDSDRFTNRLKIWNKQYEDVLTLTETLRDYQKTLSDIKQKYMDWKESTTRSGRSPNEKLEKKYLDSQEKYRRKIQETRGLLDAAKKTIYDDFKS